MSDLWKEDPEAFIILRLQESSDPNAAHKAFQAHLKEDAERDAVLKDFQLAYEAGDDHLLDELEDTRAELDRLREENDQYRGQRDGARKNVEQLEAELARLREALEERGYPFTLERENARLREENEELRRPRCDANEDHVPRAQRDTLLAALREIGEVGEYEERVCERPWEVARAAIAEVEPMMHGTLTFDPKNSEVEGEKE